MNVRALFSFAIFGSFLIGCGGGAPKPTPVSPLAGNWLITGPWPTDTFSVPVTGGLGAFSLAMSFDVNGNNITASSHAIGFCTPTPPLAPPLILLPLISFAPESTGTVATDGSFTVQSPENTPLDSLLIQGRIPQGSAGQFSGSYLASFSAPAGSPLTGSTCVGNSAGMFTATSFPLVNGVYAATGKFQTLTNGVSTVTPVALQVNLQQGVTVLDPATGLSRPNNLAIGGSIQVQGSPCFTSGTANTQLRANGVPTSSMEGNFVSVNFTMDDGSMLNLTGTLTDSTEEHISGGFVAVTSGKCGTGIYTTQLTDLARQS